VVLGEGAASPLLTIYIRGRGSAVISHSGIRGGTLVEVGFGAFGASKIANFDDFAFVLGMTVFGQVGLK